VIPSQPQRATTTHGVENSLPDRGRDRGRYRRHHGGGDLLVRPALRVLDAIHDRLESPADPLLRHAGAAYSGLQLIRAGALARIGFTVSLFIAGQALPRESDFMAAKFAVLGASCRLSSASSYCRALAALQMRTRALSSRIPSLPTGRREARAPRHSYVCGCESAPNFLHARTGRLSNPVSIRLRSPVLARHRDAGRVDHIGLDSSSPRPAGKPEAVRTRLKCQHNPFDPAASLGRLVWPSQ
jgi:Na+/H+ antiporter 1